jgi:RNA polymerase sigma-70 factor (ECF subfamily)
MALSAQRSTATPEEIHLVAAIRDGDEGAFATAVERHYGCMLALAKAFVLAPETAAQAVHDAWTAALGELERFDGRTPLRAWLLRFVVRLAAPLAAGPEGEGPHAAATAVDAERFRGGGDAFPGHWRAYPLDWHTLPDDVRRGEAVRRVLEAAIAALPVEQRAMIALRDIGGCGHREACEVLEMAEDTAHELLHGARCRVRAALERHLDD